MDIDTDNDNDTDTSAGTYTDHDKDTDADMDRDMNTEIKTDMKKNTNMPTIASEVKLSIVFEYIDAIKRLLALKTVDIFKRLSDIDHKNADGPLPVNALQQNPCHCFKKKCTSGTTVTDSDGFFVDCATAQPQLLLLPGLGKDSPTIQM
jgi:hypothetical protein